MQPAPAETQAVWQRHTAEALQQLVLFTPGCVAIRGQVEVVKALEAVAEHGMTRDAQQHAQGALMALSGKEMATNSKGPKHIMLSYQVFAHHVSLA